MLYTSYIAKLNKLPQDTIKMLVTRFPPKWLNIKEYNKLYSIQELAPSQELLLQLKKDNDWNNYVTRFHDEIESRDDMKQALNSLLKYLKQDKDVILVCFEKDYLHCHRSLLGEWVSNQGIEWKEIEF